MASHGSFLNMKWGDTAGAFLAAILMLLEKAIVEISRWLARNLENMY